MSGSHGPATERYEIEVGVRVHGRARQALADFDVSDCPGGSLLVGAIRDQAALYGVLGRLRDLGIPLVGVRRLPRGLTDPDDPRSPGPAA
ncbi:MAG TPA: hypothetical protein VFY23_16530 [Candidatus Limnocylindrales bacterium]|nr:hypothetical protein [Candidatus Limnocylindrales bacterium]